MNIKILILKVLRKIRLIRYFNIIFSTSLFKRKLKVPILSGVGIDNVFPSEEWMVYTIKRLLELKDGIFVDVGVNLGQTLIKVRCVSENVDYIGFEPNPQCIWYVNELIRINSFNNVQLVPSGIYSFEGIAQLYFDKSNFVDSRASLLKDFRKFENECYSLVPVTSSLSLKKIIGGDISIIKIDVEGAELEVLEEFKDLIEEKRPFVICEVLPAYSEDNEFRMSRKMSIENLVKNHNYKIAHIRNHGFELIERIPVDAEVEESNYLFLPHEFESTIQS